MIFLGTAAAEAYPNPFCTCPSCELARHANDPKLKRRRSSFMLDGQNLLDFNADSIQACVEYNISLAKLRNIFLTHMHEDHFDYWNLAFPNMSATPVPPINIYLSERACDGFLDVLRRAMQLPHPHITGQLEEMARACSFIPLKSGQTLHVDDMWVTPLHGRHEGFFAGELSFNYIIEKNGKTLYYATDTGRFFPQTMQALADRRLDILIVEGSFGKTILSPTAGHMDCVSLCETLDALYAQNTLDAHSRVYVTHIGHKGVFSHYDYHEYLDEKYAGRIMMAYDGLEIK